MNYRKNSYALALSAITFLCTIPYTYAQESLESTFEDTVQKTPEGTLRNRVAARLNTIQTACHHAFVDGTLKAYDLCATITQELELLPNLITELKDNACHNAADSLHMVYKKILSLKAIIIQYLKEHGTIVGNSVKVNTGISKLNELSNSLYKNGGDAFTLAKTVTMSLGDKMKKARAVLGSIKISEFKELQKL